MHWAALKGAPDDPYVLARLGLFPLAAHAKAADEKGRLGQILARAATPGTDSEDIAALSALPPSMRRWAARLVAIHDREAAISLLDGGDREAIAACLLALNRAEDARIQLGRQPATNAEAAALLAHIAISDGDHAAARTALNDLMKDGGLGPILEEGAAAFTIDDLGGSAEIVENGPKVSVVIPYRDAAATLETAIRSIANQSWRNIEIIAVDDASTDDGPQIAERMAQSDARILTIQNKRTAGVYGARNSAIDVASGDYLTFLDADDWSPVERIARQVDRLDRHAVGIGNHIRMDEAGRPVAPRVFPIVRPVPITLLTRRNTLMNAGPFEEVVTGADSEMFARLEMVHGKQAIDRDSAVLLIARWRSGSLSDAQEGGLFGQERYDYRADWMFRHAGRAAPGLPAGPAAA
ncbi:glycosyltransferase family 2 protein [Parasphingopyxis sp. CP4]|uniref:glycosyltransferase family 2 protein n=1 Tax=Parasphingopyxis sp. CP4 TaxID=2724527 RepID=UPI0015A15664|nr:glycosyltransferase family 2 protein [Parasphingopyxis sp. CP4]QLC21057.1 glycosyltransferase family 2 protein [Parasphingopyxis sp. CP4]